MLSASEFDILYQLKKKNVKKLSQRKLSEYSGYSLGKVNKIVSELLSNELIDGDMLITEKGLEELEPYKVTNAIIMAAGISSRFAPLSFERPKALLEVKGEILIEREICQLIAAGITDITVVVGYMKEKLFYLQDKFGVDIVVNEDYFRYNNTSTLIRVLDRLDNTYICSSDNYFAENVFESYVYRSYYSAEYSEEETDEYCLSYNNKGLITGVSIGGKASWYMIGHVFFNRPFSETFKKLLEKDYGKNIVRESLWEDFYIDHIKELPLYIRKYEKGIIKEFDSLDELRGFDSNYISNFDSEIFDNICEVLNCTKADVTHIEPINSGLTNTSFSFYVRDEKFVYRHPGPGTENYINRKSEAASMYIAKKLGLDDTFIYIDPEKGWKISKFVEDAVTLDYHNKDQVKLSLDMVRTLHTSGMKTDYDFDIFAEIDGFYEKLKKAKRDDFSEVKEMLKEIRLLKDYTESDGVEKCLCHSDCYDPNFLIDKKGKMYLIDWEYSGMADPASDLGTYIACSNYTVDEAGEIIEIYLTHKASDAELRHYYAYVAILSFYWFIWSIYQDSVGNPVGEWQYLWYKSAKQYMKLSISLYEEDLK